MSSIIVADASSLILLQKINLLGYLVKKLTVIIPKKVFSESIIKGKDKKFADAYLIEKKIRDKLIIIRNVKDNNKGKKIIEEFGLGYGEAEAIVLFLEQKADILTTDDHKAINVCKIYNIGFMTALTFILNAFDNKLIKENKAKKMIKELSIYGRYKDELIYKALEYIGE